ncbi:hypothetical protein KIW84_012707 [Lathyrus oleraceus]|uniref:Uncharacterized protein n=1 Tax=Pisum sativum TaxID=3888 RepID=A0A9D5GX52_PEA|nr:hypothetical protein KIW84_012707 [Pisum sativum]
MLWALSSCIGQKSCLGCVCLRSSTARSQWILGVDHSFVAYSPCVATLRFLGVGLVERSFSNCGQELRNPKQGLPQYYRHSRGTSLVLRNATLSCNGDYRGYVNPVLHKTEINIEAMANGMGVQSVANLASYPIKNLQGAELHDSSSASELFFQAPVMDRGVRVTIDRRSALMDALKLKKIERCPECKSHLDDPAVCLLCGRLCFPNWKSCCRKSGCRIHSVTCGAGTRVFLLIKRTTILLQRSRMASKISVSGTQLQKLGLDFEAFVDRISAGLKSEEIHSQQHNESFSSLDHLEAELQQLNSRNRDLTQEIVKLSTLFGHLELCIGMYNLVKYDRSVLRAFNPIHIYYFFKWNTTKAWYSLGGCLLCATGSEAMFADLCYFSLTLAIGPHVGSVMALGNGVYEALPGFQDVSSSEKANPFIRKLNMCCVVFDSNDSNKHLKEKDIKRQTLLELVDYISAVNSKFSEATM